MRAAVETVGATLCFLPQYSPDLNPIELCFAKLKTILRVARCRAREGALGHHRRLRAALCADRVPELFPPLRLFGSCALMKSALVGHIRRVLEASPFHGEGYRKAWAKLRVAGIHTSKERVRRLMREHDLQAPHRVGHAHGPKAHDGTITTEAPDVMWGTDMTATVTGGEGSACVFVAVDHCTTECIGLHAAKSGNRFEALEPVREGVRERFGDIGDGVARGLRCATTTARTTWPTMSNKRSRSSASRAPRASCGSPKATVLRSASSAR